MTFTRSRVGVAVAEGDAEGDAEDSTSIFEEYVGSTSSTEVPEEVWSELDCVAFLAGPEHAMMGIKHNKPIPIRRAGNLCFLCRGFRSQLHFFVKY
tara:strand:- start:39 stop:326 length:288 start_codon:yes stop_codon:yes gene_type:complete